MQCLWWGSNPQPLYLKSSTLPLSQRTPQPFNLYAYTNAFVVLKFHFLKVIPYRFFFKKNLFEPFLDTGKQVLWQTAKTQMKCPIRGISSGSALFAKTNRSSEKKINFFGEFKTFDLLNHKMAFPRRIYFSAYSFC